AVTTDSKTGLVTLTITWKDPALAAAWANGLVRYTNDYLRGRALEESERDITYLTQAAKATDLAGVKQAIYSILQSEISREMLARGTAEYAFKVLDPAVPPERPSSPIKSLWICLGLLGGLALSLCVIIVRSAKNSSDPPPLH
ncbi:MAG: GNVR domain-containing protein, partial [Candidatus Micrarchaeaceae archaeon]